MYYYRWLLLWQPWMPPRPDPLEEYPPQIRSLLQQAYAVDVLAALARRPHTCDGLRRACATTRRSLRSTLRMLAAHRAVGRSEAAGSWDDLDGQELIQLTTTGHQLAADLAALDQWNARAPSAASSDPRVGTCSRPEDGKTPRHPLGRD